MSAGHQAEQFGLAALQDQYAALGRRIVRETQLEAFEETEEFGILSGHGAKLRDIATVLGARYLDHAGRWRLDEEGILQQCGADDKPIEFDEVSDTEYLRENGIPVDLVPLTSPVLDQPHKVEVAREANDVINACANNLYYLRHILATESPDIRIGSEVTVWRSPVGDSDQPWTDDGWAITGFLANGTILVAKGDMSKNIPADELMGMNNRL